MGMPWFFAYWQWLLESDPSSELVKCRDPGLSKCWFKKRNVLSWCVRHVAFSWHCARPNLGKTADWGTMCIISVQWDWCMSGHGPCDTQKVCQYVQPANRAALCSRNVWERHCSQHAQQSCWQIWQRPSPRFLRNTGHHTWWRTGTSLSCVDGVLFLFQVFGVSHGMILYLQFWFYIYYKRKQCCKAMEVHKNMIKSKKVQPQFLPCSPCQDQTSHSAGSGCRSSQNIRVCRADLCAPWVWVQVGLHNPSRILALLRHPGVSNWNELTVTFLWICKYTVSINQPIN